MEQKDFTHCRELIGAVMLENSLTLPHMKRWLSQTKSLCISTELTLLGKLKAEGQQNIHGSLLARFPTKRCEGPG